MPVVRRIRNRGATITVESHAEVLFMPGGSVNRWANRFTGRIRAATIKAAPTNKRPRWGHYGKPLKETIVSARPRFWGNGRDKQRVYGAVGSTAPHAYYVDQGTGVFAGNGPYEAKILPPWTRGGASLYEATWRPTGPEGRKVAPVMIKGQKGQKFFEEGLADAFRSMRLRSFQVPGDPKITGALRAIPTGLDNFAGNTENTPAFRTQLEEWRSWRDEAWENYEGLGRGGGVGSRMHRKFMDRALEETNSRIRKNQAAYRASVEAAKRRRKKQNARILAMEEAKRIGKEKREAAEAAEREAQRKEAAQRALLQGNAQMEFEARRFLAMIKEQYPNARIGSMELEGGVVLWQVKYTDDSGETHSQKWAYGH